MTYSDIYDVQQKGFPVDWNKYAAISFNDWWDSNYILSSYDWEQRQLPSGNWLRMDIRYLEKGIHLRLALQR